MSDVVKGPAGTDVVDTHMETTPKAAPDNVDTTYGKDMQAVDTDNSTTLGEEEVASGEMASTSGVGGATSRANAPTPKAVEDRPASAAEVDECAPEDLPPGSPGVPSEPNPPIPDSEVPEDAPEQEAFHPTPYGRFVAFKRMDGTRFAVGRWDVLEFSENTDGTVNVVLPGRDVVSGPGQVVATPVGVVRVTVAHSFDEVSSMLEGLGDDD